MADKEVDREGLYNEFTKEFPLSKLENLKLEEYTEASDAIVGQRNDFTYWIEYKLPALGGMGVYSPVETYGIYKLRQAEKRKDRTRGYMESEEGYAWKSNVGDSLEAAWREVHSVIYDIATYAQNGQFSLIDDIGSGVVSEQYKWKVAFLYSGKKITNIFKKESLVYLAKSEGGYFWEKPKFSELTKFVFDNYLNNKPNYWDAADKLWGKWLKAGDDKKELLSEIKKEIDNRKIGFQYVINSEDALHKGKELFIWIGTSDGLIGDEKCHYEFVFSTSNDNLLRTMVHFEEKRTRAVFKNIVKKKGLCRKDSNDWFQIDGKDTDIDLLTVAESEIPERAINNLIILDNLVGEDLKKEIRRQKGMEEIKEYINAVIAGKNVIFSGAPGTGKTHLAKKIASAIVGQENIKTNIGFVQFHQSYDYTDFVEGLRPTPPDKNGNIGFELKDGIFKEFCTKALNNPNSSYVFIIDEINRGEPSKILGELFYSIDPGYRVSKKQLEEGGITSIRTQYANTCSKQNAFDDALGIDGDGEYGHFFVPDNVYIIGTMNDIDRSVESIDFAFRRRFTWIEITAAETQKAILDNLNSEWKEPAKKRMDGLNAAIWNGEEGVEGLSSSYHIGAAYFLKLNDLNGDFKKLWDYHLAPLLHEYLRGMDDSKEKFDKLEKVYFAN